MKSMKGIKGFDCVITLQDDCIFSERNATEGAHRALDYIPGGALLGAVAAAIYPQHDAEQAFNTFHSGKVRFSNAYPMTADRQRTFPMPACWHQAKGQSATDGDKLDQRKVWRLDQLPEHQLPDNEQPQQLRDGYLAINGTLAKTTKSFRMKTAIDAGTGRAKDGVLFGYDALKAGQCFYAQISCDAQISDEEVAAIQAVFERPLLLGRSRSAEYGRARVQLLSGQAESLPPYAGELLITLWLQSDLLALDQYGQPTLSPLPQDLGLPTGQLLVDSSFLRTRRYSTWNAHKRGYEMERQVINKGSVLVYQLDTALTDKHLTMIAQGLGLERQAGLGQVWLNPLVLAQVQPDLGQADPVTDLSNTADIHNNTVPAEPELIAWLRTQQGVQVSKQQHMQKARRIVLGLNDASKKTESQQSYQALQESVRRLKGLDENVHTGPSQSQWSSVLRDAKNPDALRCIFDANNGSCKPSMEGWKDEFWYSSGNGKENGEGQRCSFYQWFKTLCYENPQAPFIQNLVREIMAELKEHKGDRS